MVATEDIISQAPAEDHIEEDMEDDSMDNKAEALLCLMDGKRNLICKDIPGAVSSLADACKLMSAECGEKAPECGEVYYFYGKALLELARLENIVLGNALSGVPKEESCDGSPQVDDPEIMTDEERIEVQCKVDEALMENLDNCQIAENPMLKKEVVIVADKESVVELSSEDKLAEGDHKIEEVLEAEESDEEDSDHLDEEKAEEDPSNLQLAWEVLELSKIICREQLEESKDLSTETKAAIEKRYCDTFFLLSEVSVESGNYYQAVEDLKVCLERQKTLLPEDNRNIAETLYYLGVALGFHKNFDEAIMSLEAAVSVLTKRMANLEGKAGTQAKNEATEIKALLPEVKAKITDTKDLKAETVKKAAELYLIGGKTVESSTKPVSTIPVKKVDGAK